MLLLSSQCAVLYCYNIENPTLPLRPPPPHKHTPGVLTVALHCTSLSSTYCMSTALCQPLSTPPQLNNTSLYNAASHSSVCAACVYVSLSLFFLEVPFQGRVVMERVRRSCASMHKHLHIWDAWEGLPSWYTVNTHTHTLISMHMFNKSWGTPALSSANKVWQPGNSM